MLEITVTLENVDEKKLIEYSADFSLTYCNFVTYKMPLLKNIVFSKYLALNRLKNNKVG